MNRLGGLFPLSSRLWGEVEQALLAQALVPFLDEVTGQRASEIATIAHHMEISLQAIIDRVQVQFADLMVQKEAGARESGLEGRLKQTEDRLDELNGRLERRRQELEQERHCAIADVEHLGRAWVLPHPERTSPAVAPMVRDEEIERIAVQQVIAYEEARGWRVESVESENRGFDLISRRPHPEDPQTALEVRFIEVKGRAGEDVIPLSPHEYQTAARLGKDYWLYTVFNCASTPVVHAIQDPARLDWKSLVKIEHYYLEPNVILQLEGEAP